jgi:glycosyltransferase involved in cell wall biosynthesis
LPTTTAAPRYSVIVPTFNRRDTIGATLESLQAQTLQDFELVVVDDGSTDGTEELVRGYGFGDLHYHWQENAGPAAARNKGGELGRAEYLAFIDTGDVAQPDWLASFDKMIRAYDCDFVSSAGHFTRAGSPMGQVNPRRLGPGSGRAVALWRTGCFAIRRDLFLGIGGFDPELWFSEVTEFGMRLGQFLSDQRERMTHITRSLVAVELPLEEGRGGRAQSLAYSDQRRLETAQYILEKHERVMTATPRLRQIYLRICGVANARLRNYVAARAFFWRAWKVKPITVKELARLAVACVPAVAVRVWPPGD